MLSEHSTKKTQARAFSFFAFSGNLGIFLGPLIGIFSFSSYSDLLLIIQAGCCRALQSNTPNSLDRIAF